MKNKKDSFTIRKDYCYLCGYYRIGSTIYALINEEDPLSPVISVFGCNFYVENNGLHTCNLCLKRLFREVKKKQEKTK